MAYLARPPGVGDVPDEKPFGEFLPLGSTPAGSDALEGGDHFSFGHLDLDGPGVCRSGKECHVLRMAWVGDIENGPAPVPEMAHVEVPAAVDLLHCQLEGRPSLEIMVAQYLDVVRERRCHGCVLAATLPRDHSPPPQKNARREKASNPVWIAGEKAIPL